MLTDSLPPPSLVDVGITKRHWEAIPAKWRKRASHALDDMRNASSEDRLLKAMRTMRAGLQNSLSNKCPDDADYPEYYSMLMELKDKLCEGPFAPSPCADIESASPVAPMNSSDTSAGCSSTTGHQKAPSCVTLSSCLPKALGQIGIFHALGHFGLQIVQAYFAAGMHAEAASYAEGACAAHATRVHRALHTSLKVQQRRLQQQLGKHAESDASSSMVHLSRASTVNGEGVLPRDSQITCGQRATKTSWQSKGAGDKLTNW